MGEDLKNSTSPALLLVCHDYNAGSKGEMEGITERYSKIMKGSWVDQFRYGSNPWMARYLYALLFLIANLLAWAVRDYGLSILKEIKSKIASFFDSLFWPQILFLVLHRSYTIMTMYIYDISMQDLKDVMAVKTVWVQKEY